MSRLVGPSGTVTLYGVGYDKVTKTCKASVSVDGYSLIINTQFLAGDTYGTLEYAIGEGAELASSVRKELNALNYWTGQFYFMRDENGRDYGLKATLIDPATGKTASLVVNNQEGINAIGPRLAQIVAAWAVPKVDTTRTTLLAAVKARL